MLTLLNLSFSTSRAAEEPYIGGLKHSQIVNTAEFYVIDSKFWDPVQKIDYSTENIITFRIDPNAAAYYQNLTFTATADILVKVYNDITNPSIETGQFNIQLAVSFDPSTGVNYKGEAYYKFADAHKFKVILNQITPSQQGITIPSVFELSGKTIVKRKYSFSPISSATTTFGIDGNKVNLQWIPQFYPGAELYDVEYTFIDSGSLQAQQVRNSITANQPIDPSLFTAIFRNNATRITTPNIYHTVNAAYEKGLLLFRIRGVQYPNEYNAAIDDVNEKNLRLEGDWNYQSKRLPDLTYNYNVVELSGHENALNWQYSASFAEEGKKKEVINYLDGTLRNRQNVTLDNSEGKAIVQESMYDVMGRPAVNVLPSPTNDKAIHFFANFNVNNASKGYSYKDLLPSLTSCNIAPAEMSVSSGASRYYSPANNIQYFDANNTVLPSPVRDKYIPDAEKKPFSIVQYTPDNTGRISRQSGVGATMQPEQEHDTKYFYSKPAQEELDRLFGIEAGMANHYLKNTVIDANGQMSVSYVNASGKTVATALAGLPNANLSSLASTPSPGQAVAITRKLLTPQDFVRDLNDRTIKGNSTFSVAVLPGTYDFDYKIDPVRLQLGYGSTGASFVCSDCYYDLKIVVTDACGNTIPTVSFTRAQLFNEDCNTTPGSLTGNFSVSPPALGEYNISFVLKIDEDAIKYYEEKYLVNNNDIKKINTFLRDELRDADFEGCFNNCKTCVAELGTMQEFVAKAKQLYLKDSMQCTAEDEAYLQTLYTRLSNHCQALQTGCQSSFPCQEKYELMLADVSPGGQYALYTECEDGQATGCNGTQLDGPLVTPTGRVVNVLSKRSVVSYFDDDGTTPLTLEYPENSGKFLSPSNPQIPLAFFIENFDARWAKSFIKYHPENCLLEWCKANSASNDFDEAVEAENDPDAAITKGWFGSVTSLLQSDPFFNGASRAGIKTEFQNELNNFSSTSQGHSNETPVKNIMKVIDYELYCQAGSNAIAWSNCNTSASDPCRSRYMEWMLYKEYYLNLKRKYNDKVRLADPNFSTCSNCFVGTDNVPASSTCQAPPATDFTSQLIASNTASSQASLRVTYRNGAALTSYKYMLSIAVSNSSGSYDTYDREFRAFQSAETLTVPVSPSGNYLITNVACVNETSSLSTCQMAMVVTSPGLSTLNAGVLTSGSHTIGEYVIDWYLNSVTGVPKFTSGSSTNAHPDVTQTHPFTGEIVQGGTWIPVIRTVYLDGVLYNSANAPCLDTALGETVVTSLSCANGSTIDAYFKPEGPYSHSLSYTNNVNSTTLASRSVRFDLDATTKYFAWNFIAYQEPDRIKIYYVSPGNGTNRLLETWNVGENLPYTDVTAAEPYLRNVNLAKVTPLTSSFATGDYLRIEITPGANSNTNWKFYSKCLATVDNTIADDRIRAITPGSVTMTYDAASCRYVLRYNKLLMTDPAAGGGPFSAGVFQYHSYMHPRGSFPTPGASNNSLYSPTTEIYMNYNTQPSNRYHYQPYGCSPLAGTQTIKKVGDVVTASFSNAADYNYYKTVYNNVVNSVQLPPFVNDNTNTNYYQPIHVWFLIGNNCGDSYDTKTYEVNRNNPILFNDGAMTMTITKGTIVNGYVPQACSNLSSSIENITRGINYGVYGSDYTLVTSLRYGEATIGGGSPIFGTAIVPQLIEETDLQAFGEIEFHSVDICDLGAKGWRKNTRPYYDYEWASYYTYDRVKITNTADPVNNFELWRLVEKQSGDEVPQGILVYKVAGGVVTDNVNDYNNGITTTTSASQDIQGIDGDEPPFRSSNNEPMASNDRLFGKAPANNSSSTNQEAEPPFIGANNEPMAVNDSPSGKTPANNSPSTNKETDPPKNEVCPDVSSFTAFDEGKCSDFSKCIVVFYNGPHIPGNRKVIAKIQYSGTVPEASGTFIAEFEASKKMKKYKIRVNKSDSSFNYRFKVTVLSVKCIEKGKDKDAPMATNSSSEITTNSSSEITAQSSSEQMSSFQSSTPQSCYPLSEFSFSTPGDCNSGSGKLLQVCHMPGAVNKDVNIFINVYNNNGEMVETLTLTIPNGQSCVSYCYTIATEVPDPGENAPSNDYVFGMADISCYSQPEDPVSLSSSCQSNVNYPFFKDKERRFPGYADAGNFLQQLQQQNNSATGEPKVAALCATMCEAQSDAWISSLTACNLSLQQQTVLRQKLIEICMSGCSASNPTGSSSDVTNRSFQTALSEVTGQGPDKNCSADLISNPYPLNRQPKAGYEVVLLVSDCQKNKVLNYRNQFIASGQSNFYQYLQNTLGEPLRFTEAQLTNLVNVCLSNCAPNRYLDKPMVFPLLFDCDAYPCLTWSQFATHRSNFLAKYPGIQDSADNYELLFTNYVNHITGFSLSYADYKDYLDANNSSASLCNKPMAPDVDPAIEQNACMFNIFQVALTNANTKYVAYIQEVREEFRTAYVAKCINVQPLLSLKTRLYEYHYTLYYYDQSDNLIKTIPPKGVNALSETEVQQVQQYRQANSTSCMQTGNDLQFNNGYHFQFPSKTDYVPNSSEAYTFEFWVNPSNQNSEGLFSFNTSSSSAEKGFSLRLVNSKLVARAGMQISGAMPEATSNNSNVLSSGKWHHVVVVFNLLPSNWATIYVDGNVVPLLFNSISPTYVSPDDFVLRVGAAAADNNMIGSTSKIRQFRWYKRILPLNEVRMNAYNSCGTPVSTTALIFRAPMNEGSGNIVDEHSSTAGVLVGSSPAWSSQAAVYPQHTLATTYAYNSLNQVVEQNTPDAGTSRFWYDYLGRLTASQNAEQLAPADTSAVANRFSYTRYDALGRIVEVGEKTGGQTPVDINLNNTANPDNNKAANDWLAVGVDRQVTQTIYDNYDPNTVPHTDITTKQGIDNNRKRVVATIYRESKTGALPDYDQATHYAYDISGNVRTVWQEIKLLRQVNPASNGIKRIDYDYDLVSGKVNKVKYQPGKGDQFVYRYAYDAGNRIKKAESSRDELVWHNDADYFYYLHGPLGRVELGSNKVQGIDYAYTLQGWLKGINGQKLDPAKDISKDGTTTNDGFARDVMAFTLNYFNNDYKPIKLAQPGTEAFNLAYQASSGLGAELFNGNISAATVALSKINNGSIAGYTYRYDQLNRLVSNSMHSGLDNVSTWNNSFASPGYFESATYDPNGNILSYLRNAANTSTQNGAMDNLQYNYPAGSNRLTHVDDAVSSSNSNVDIDDQEANNYRYDKIGNLQKDEQENILNIKWNVYGKLRTIFKGDKTISYGYNTSGQRVYKAASDAGNSGGSSVNCEPGTAVDNLVVNVRNGTTPTVYRARQSITFNPNFTSNENDYFETILDASAPLCVPPNNNDPNVALSSGKLTFYIRDAQGNTMGVYDYDANTSADLKWSEQHLYGSSRLGLWRYGTTVPANPMVVSNAQAIYDEYKAGGRLYELTNHLGNVLGTVSDKKLQHSPNSSSVDYYEADVVSQSDYYPFGMLQPGRTFNATNYRYGFNGKENDNEVKNKEGSQQDYGMRIYDTRLGRFLSVDPMADAPKLIGTSPYAFALNNPILYFDADGAYPIEIHVRSFAPFDWFGPRKLWHGDGNNRRFSTNSSYGSRISMTTAYETTTQAGSSRAFGALSYTKYGAWAYSDAYLNDGQRVVNTKGNNLNLHLYGKNEALVPGSSGTESPGGRANPTYDIDVHSKLSINDITQDDGTHILSLSGQIAGDAFPSAEAYVNDAKGNSVFLGVAPTSFGSVEGPTKQLRGDRKIPMINVNLQIQTDKDGIFTGVIENGKTINLSDYKKRYESISPIGQKKQ